LQKANWIANKEDWFLERKSKMGDMVMDERWNAIDSADMALGVRWAIDYIKRDKEPPPKYIQSLEKGIEFLEEARAGGTLISSGSLKDAGSFKGTFSPLCMATDVYITFEGTDSPKKSEDYEKVSKLLNDYICALVSIKEKGVKCRIGDKIFSNVERFFETLFDILAQQSDPIIKEYSRPYAL
jgi:hypothetical protein